MSKGLVCIEMKLVRSQAFRDLTGKSQQVLLEFLCRRKMENRGTKKRENWVIANNGEIVYTYDEAERQGIGRKAFSRAIGQLVGHGFIDIARPGIGIGRVATLYSISQRWRKYGRPDFEAKARLKRRTYCFPKGQEHPRHK